MCRTTDFDGFKLRVKNTTSLRIKAFYLRFISGSVKKPNTPLPESLTLLFLPRIDETDLSVNGSKILPDLPALLPLHRVVSDGEAVFGSRARVRAGEGVRFEVYFREVRVLEGTFLKNGEENWKLDLKSCLEEAGQVFLAAEVAEVCVGLEEHVAVTDRVEIRNKKKNNNNNNNNNRLEVIPERREEEEEEVEESDGAYCWECEESDGGEDCERMEKDLEGVRWAVDLGILVMCLGVGYLVSKASAKSLRRSMRRSRIL